jgi:hypothetical protein
LDQLVQGVRDGRDPIAQGTQLVVEHVEAVHIEATFLGLADGLIVKGLDQELEVPSKTTEAGWHAPLKGFLPAVGEVYRYWLKQLCVEVARA